MGEFSANLRYDLQTPEKANEALKVVTSEPPLSANFTLNFSVDGKYLLAEITAKSSVLLQEGLNATYPLIEKVI